MQIGDYVTFTAPSLFHDGGQSQHTGIIGRLPKENPANPRDRFYVIVSGGKPLHVPANFIVGPAPGIPPAVDLERTLALRDQFPFRRKPVP